MGEYAYYQGQRIKIGTCENLTDIRPEHVPAITGYSFGRAVLEGVRFRFPFPEEDGTAPGEFNGLDKALNVPGAEFDGDFDHSTIHVKTGEGGLHPKSGDRIRFSMPCPLGPKGDTIREAAGYPIHGLPSGVNIVQQRAWDGLLVLVAECPACGARFRLPTLDDVEPVLTAINQQAAAYDADADRAANRADMWRREGNNPRAEADDSDARHARSRATYWRTVAARIEEGYANPPAWVAVSAPQAEPTRPSAFATVAAG